MVKEAEKFAEEDKKKKEEVELFNQANSFVYATEKSLKEYGDKVSASDKENIEKEINNLKEAIKAKDQAKTKSGMESLQKASHKLAEEIYKSTASQQAAQGGAQEGQANQQGAGGADSGGAQRYGRFRCRCDREELRIERPPETVRGQLLPASCRIRALRPHGAGQSLGGYRKNG